MNAISGHSFSNQILFLMPKITNYNLSQWAFAKYTEVTSSALRPSTLHTLYVETLRARSITHIIITGNIKMKLSTTVQQHCEYCCQPATPSQQPPPFHAPLLCHWGAWNGERSWSSCHFEDYTTIQWLIMFIVTVWKL